MKNLGHGALAGKKTYVTAVVAVIGAIGMYLTGDSGLADTFQVIVTALSAAFIRHGVAKA